MTDSLIYVDGVFVAGHEAAISPTDRGFTLGDGVFETMLVQNGQVFRLGAHLRRLRNGLGQLDIALPKQDEQLETAINELLTRNGLVNASLRLTVSRGIPEARGLLPGAVLSGSTVVIQAAPFAGYPAEAYARGFAAMVSHIRRNEKSPTAYLKACSYLENVLVRMAAAAAGCDEGLMLNTAGKVACGSMSNIFVVKEGGLRTPPIAAGILAGITRAAVIDIAHVQRISVQEEDLTLDDLRTSDEAFLTNSLMGLMPLTRLDSQPIGLGSPGPVTQRLSNLYQAVVRKETAPKS